MNDVCLASCGDNAIKLWSPSYSFLKQYNPHSNNITRFCWSNDNSFIASISSEGDGVALSYTATSKYSNPISFADECTSLAFNSNSRYISTGSSTGFLRVFDLKTNKEKRSLQAHQKPVTAVAFNYNDADIAVSSESGGITICNVVNGQLSKPFTHPNGQCIRQIRYSLIKKSLLGSVSNDGVVNLWDTHKRVLLHSFSSEHTAPCTDLAFSSVNEMLMMSVGLDKKIACWDVINKKHVKTMIAEYPLTSIASHPNGSIIAVGTTKGKIYVHDLRKSSKYLHCLDGHKASVQCLSFQNIIMSNNTNLIGRNRITQDVNANDSSIDVSITNHSNVAKTIINQQREKLEFLDAFSPMKEGASSLMDVDESISAYKSTNRNSQTPIQTLSREDSLLCQNADSTQINTTNNFTDGIFSPIGGNSSTNCSPSKLSHTQSYNESLFLKSSSQITGRASMDSDVSSNSSHQQDSSGMNTSLDLHKNDSVVNFENVRSNSTINTNQVNNHNASNTENSTTNNFSIEVLQNIVKDTVDDIRESMRKDFVSLYVDIVKQFQIQQNETREMISQQNSLCQELLRELTRLREENRRLKETY